MNIATFDLAPMPLQDLMALREAVERVVDEVVRGDITHKEQNAMTKALDGMSIEQLRELARRAEATAKAQEEDERKSRVVVVAGGRYTVNRHDGTITGVGLGGTHYPDIARFIASAEYNRADLREAARIISDAAIYKSYACGFVGLAR